MRVRLPPSALPVASEATGGRRRPAEPARRGAGDPTRQEGGAMDSAQMVDEERSCGRPSGRRARPPSRRPGRPDEMAMYIEPPYLSGWRVPAGFAAGSTASSTTSSAPSPRASDPARRPRPRRVQPAQVRATGAEGACPRSCCSSSYRRRDRLLRRTCGDELPPARVRSTSASRQVAATSATLRGAEGAAARLACQQNVNRPELVAAHGYDTKYAMPRPGSGFGHRTAREPAK